MGEVIYLSDLDKADEETEEHETTIVDILHLFFHDVSSNRDYYEARTSQLLAYLEDHDIEIKWKE